MKKWFAFILLPLVAVFLFSLPIAHVNSSNAYAAGIGPTSGECGENATWSYSNGTLTITGTGPMTDFKYDTQPWGNWLTSITTLIVENGITSIGSYSLYGGTTLSSVQLPSSITTIGNNAFYRCSSLKSITLPNSLTTISNSAFANSGLTNIVIPNSVTALGSSCFSWCSSLEKATLSDRITSIPENLFSVTNRLREVNIPDGVISIGSFAFNHALFTSITLPDSVKTIGIGAFADCSHLADVYFSGSIDMANQIEIGNNNSYLTGASWHFADEEKDPGDVNEDAIVDVNDACLILSYCAGQHLDINATSADVNADGNVNIHDALLIMQYVAGWNVTLK